MMNRFSRTLYCLFLCPLVAYPRSFVRGIFATEENSEECQVYGDTLQCDFKFTKEDVRIDESVNKFKTVYLMNAKQLLLRNGLCTSLNLYHISSVIYTSGTDSQESDSCSSSALYIHNVTIDYIPPFLRTLSMENSRLLGSFHTQPFLRMMKVSNSFIQELNLHPPVGVDGEIRLHNSTISLFVKLELTENSKFFLTDSVVQDVVSSAFTLYKNSSVEIMRTSFLQKGEVEVFLDEDAKITLGDIKGFFSVLRKKNTNKKKNVEENVAKIQAIRQDVNRAASVSVIEVILALLVLSAVCIILKMLFSRKQYMKNNSKQDYESCKDPTPS